MTRDRPAASGTVTFLFSDIERSTQLEQALGTERYGQVLERHRALLRAAWQANGGIEQGTEGDSFFVTFGRATSALAAAIAGQRALHGEAWPGGVDVRVRMGLHTGEVISEEGDYFGMNVILAARIAAQAVGGEILVSEEMRDAAKSGNGNGNGLSFDGGRELELKGLAGRHRVFRAEWAAQETAA